MVPPFPLPISQCHCAHIESVRCVCWKMETLVVGGVHATHICRLVDLESTGLRVLVVAVLLIEFLCLLEAALFSCVLQHLQALLAVLRHTFVCDQLLTHAVHRLHVASLEGGYEELHHALPSLFICKCLFKALLA